MCNTKTRRLKSIEVFLVQDEKRFREKFKFPNSKSLEAIQLGSSELKQFPSTSEHTI